MLSKPDFNSIKWSINNHAEAYEDDSSQTNYQSSRVMSSITLNSANNTTVSYYFLSLTTSKEVVKGSWHHLPMCFRLAKRNTWRSF